MTNPQKVRKTNQEKPWMLRKKYNSAFYAFLVKNALPRLESLAMINEQDESEAKKYILKELGLTKVLVGGIAYNISECMRYQIHAGIKNVLKGARKYAEKYKSQFESEVADGRVTGVFGSQALMEFSGRIETGTFWEGRRPEIPKEELGHVHSTKRR